MTNAVKLGAGCGTGMFFHAPAGTALPVSPYDELDEAWEEVGYVSEDGIGWHTGRSGEPLKDWAGKTRRILESSDDRTVTVPIISTTEEVLKTIFGEDNVTVTPATSTHGKIISFTAKQGAISGEEAFLFIMKDGDDMTMLGTTRGFVSTLDDITFAPGTPIIWNATIVGDEWTDTMDDNQKTT